jgi:hypothetical protein
VRILIGYNNYLKLYYQSFILLLMADFFIIYTSLECGVCGNRDKANRKDKTILNALNVDMKQIQIFKQVKQY